MKEEMKDERLKKAVRDLPKLSPPESTWDSIEEQLNGQMPQTENKKWYRLLVAMVLLLMVSGYMLNERSKSLDINIQFSEETSLDADPPFADFLSDDTFDELLGYECDGLSSRCDTDDFQELISQLAELKIKASEMILLINQAGYDEYLMKAKSRIENENAKVKREIMALFRG
ncbi:MAG: hypothetical protein ACJAVN_001684 [Roseivirga sp.]|jgi:hypothetical protein